MTTVFVPCDGIECARMTVPLRYDEPSAGSVELAVYRRTGSDPSASTRPLFVHPGGPGADVRQVVAGLSTLLGSDAEKFDVIGLATRASQDTTGADCGPDLSVFIGAIEQERLASRFAEDCATVSGRLVGASGTLDSVEDMEQLRRLLGMGKVSYIGWSYGATLGAAWVMSHPDSLRSVVLDAPADPGVAWAGPFAQQQQQQEQNLLAATDACDRNPSCPVADGSLARILAMQEDLTRTPRIVGSSARPVDGLTVAMAIELASYAGDYGRLFAAVRSGERGDHAPLGRMADERLGRSEQGDDEGGMETQTVVRCSDMSDEDAAEVVAIEQGPDPGAPTIGIGAVIERVCLELPGSGRPLRGLIENEAAKQASVLVVTTENDPVMPSRFAIGLARRMEWGVKVVPASRHLAVGYDPVATTAARRCLVEASCR